VLWKDKDHIGIKQLWEYFCSYIYLPRLKDRDVLLRAIQEGISTVVSSTEFAYAEAYDEQTGRYVGLRMGGGGSVVMDSSSVLVKPEVAQAQIEEEDRRRAETADGTDVPSGITYDPAGDGDSRVAEPPAGTAVRQELPRRFHASVTLDRDRVGRDAGMIADEVLSHLSTLPGARLNVSLEIEADIPQGAPEEVQRTVSENAGVLKFDSHGFEQDCCALLTTKYASALAGSPLRVANSVLPNGCQIEAMASCS
jgi:hypothetical protein